MANILNIFNEFPKGSNLTIVNTLFNKPKKNKDGKWGTPSIDLIAKDLDTGIKHRCNIYDPDYIYFIAKNPESIKHHLDFIPKSDVSRVMCKYRDITKSIAEVTNNKNFFSTNIRMGDYRENEKLHTLNQIFFSDMNIEDYYRFWFSKTFKNVTFTPNKSYLDIEVDVIDIKGDFPEPGEAPVSVVTYIFNGIINTYILRNIVNPNPLISQFERLYNDGLLDSELNDLIIDTVGGVEKANKYNVANLQFRPRFFDNEIQLIASLFAQINEDQPDFVLAWNMAFDIPYLIERIKNLGYTPESIICHKDFEDKSVYYYIDARSENDLAERGDYAFISSYSVYLDQMIQYASRRKGGPAIPSFSLNNIGTSECGVKKLDYHHITYDLGQLPYLDFKTYVFYNIVDVVVQMCIEAQVGDIDYVFNASVMNNTRYSKIHRQTVYLRNKQTSFYWDLGFVVGNNINKWNEKPKEKFSGAFVADPNLVNDSAKLKINGIPVFLCDNLVDFDFSSLYPSTTREFNLSNPTQIGKIIIDKPVHDKENPLMEDEYDRGSAFVEDYVTHDHLSFASRWLGLPSYMKAYKEIKDMFNSGRIDTMIPFRSFDSQSSLIENDNTEYKDVLNATVEGDYEVRALYRADELPGRRL